MEYSQEIILMGGAREAGWWEYLHEILVLLFFLFVLFLLLRLHHVLGFYFLRVHLHIEDILNLININQLSSSPKEISSPSLSSLNLVLVSSSSY